MRIVDVNPFFFPYNGGIEHRMHSMAKRLAERGHDVTILTSQLKGTECEEKVDGYTVIRLPSRYLNVYNPPYVSTKGVLAALDSLDAEVVNYNYRWAPSWNRDLALYGGRKLYTCHNTWGEGVGIQGKISMINDRRFIDNVLNTFDHTVCVSRELRKDTVSMGIPLERTSYIPNCLDESTVPHMAPEGEYILSLGRLVKVKGLEYLVEAMRYVDCRLVICGKGPEESNLRKLISKYGLEDKVEMHGFVGEDEKPSVIEGSMFFVMPSLFEAFGITAIENMSYGRPIIHSGVNGLADTVGNAGIVVNPRDPRSIADGINTLLSDEGLRMELREKAVEQASRFTYDTHVPRYERILEAVASGDVPDPDI